MNSLSTYVSALKGKETAVAIVENHLAQHRIEDDGVTIESIERTVTFSNGVTLQVQQEFDHVNEQVEDVCAECWITYEITANPQNLPIRPRKKSLPIAAKKHSG